MNQLERNHERDGNEKKKGERKYNRFFIEEFFKKPWCPLFGHIFWNDEPLPPRSQIERCFKIIQDARRLWETEDANGFDRSNGWHGWHSWPEPEEIPDYPKDLILAAREIARCWMSIYKYSVIFPHQPGAYYKKENGDSEPIHTLDTVGDKAIYIAKSICHRNYLDKDGTVKTINKFKDIPDYALLKKSIEGWDNLEIILPDIIKPRQKKSNSEIARYLQQIDYYAEYEIPELNDSKHTWKVGTLRKKVAIIKKNLPK